MKFFRIKNWDKYHHRDHKKTMPWIKLDAFIFQDARFMSLSDNMKLFWIGLLTLSAKNGNTFVWNSAMIRRGLELNGYLKLDEFLELDLIEECLPNGQRVDDAPSPSLDKRREEKRRDSAPALRSVPQNSPQNLDHENSNQAWQTILKWMRQHSSQEDRNFPWDVRTISALQNIGGMNAVRKCPDKDAPFLEIKFKKEFESLKATG